MESGAKTLTQKLTISLLPCLDARGSALRCRFLGLDELEACSSEVAKGEIASLDGEDCWVDEAWLSGGLVSSLPSSMPTSSSSSKLFLFISLRTSPLVFL